MLEFTVTIVYSFGLIGLPAYFYYKLSRNFGNLETIKFQKSYSAMIEGISTKTHAQVYYNVLFMIRRLITVIVLVFAPNIPYLQSATLLLLSTTNLIYVSVARPFQSNFENRTEIFNEFTIMLCSYMFTFFLNIAAPLDLREKMGIVTIVIAVSNVLGNLLFIGYSILADIFYSIKD